MLDGLAQPGFVRQQGPGDFPGRDCFGNIQTGAEAVRSGLHEPAHWGTEDFGLKTEDIMAKVEIFRR